MKSETITEIEFACPNCQQQFTAGDYRAGTTFECTQCQTEFEIPGEPPAPAPPPPTLAQKAAKVIAGLASKPDERTEAEKLFDEAQETAGSGSNLLAVGVVIFIFAAIAAAAYGTSAMVIGGGIAAVFLAFGLVYKILAQLIFIRAELRAKRDP